MRRAWERLDVELDPPLAPREARTLSFDLTGMPAEVDFALQAPGNFRRRWDRYRRAKEAIALAMWFAVGAQATGTLTPILCAPLWMLLT